MTVEEQRHVGQIARLVSKCLQASSVTYITRSRIEDGVEIDEDCYSPDDITSALLEANASKYKQCGNSPFLQQPLLNDFGC